MEIWTPKYIQVTSSNFRGWRDVIGCETDGPGMCGFLYAVSNNHTSILHSYGDNEPQRYCSSDLDNLGHVTLPDMWPFDGPCALSYWRSVITMYQSWTVIEIWSLKDIRVTFVTFCGLVTSSVTWPFVSPCWPGWQQFSVAASATKQPYLGTSLLAPNRDAPQKRQG